MRQAADGTAVATVVNLLQGKVLSAGQGLTQMMGTFRAQSCVHQTSINLISSHGEFATTSNLKESNSRCVSFIMATAYPKIHENTNDIHQTELGPDSLYDWTFLVDDHRKESGLPQLVRAFFFPPRNARRISVESLRFQPTTSRRRIKRTGPDCASFFEYQ